VSEKNSREKELDDFWDISRLVPTKKNISRRSVNISLTDIQDGEGHTDDPQSKLTEASTVIKRFIPPHSGDILTSKPQPTYAYTPKNSLIHRVSLYKESSNYAFYEDFCKTARDMWHKNGHPCEYADFFSYSPQYDQLSDAQMSYYLWWRENLRKGNFIKTNFCYISLYTYELINVSDIISPLDTRARMIDILVTYPDVLVGMAPRYIRWISDYSLIHELPPPQEHSQMLVKSAGALKEYFVSIPGDTPEGWARTLLRYCCSYDYRSSKFAVDENIELFNTHVLGAVSVSVRYLSQSGGILSKLPFGDCKLTVKAFEGAICSWENRYTIDVEYCSFSRSHELRFLVGDVVKYAENKIRAHIFVKSRLTVYSLPSELTRVIDAYFSEALPPVRRSVPKKQETHDYDALYDLPRAELDLSNAERIEQESWQTTKELVETFDEEQQPQITDVVKEFKPMTVDPSIIMYPTETEEETDLEAALGEYYEAVKALASGDISLLSCLAGNQGKSTDLIVDKINEIAVEVIGDILVDGDGNYYVIDDYKDLL
jgi:hypothetical protein